MSNVTGNKGRRIPRLGARLTLGLSAILVATLGTASACSSEPEGGLDDLVTSPGPIEDDGSPSDPNDSGGTPEPGPTALDDREISYGDALRTVSLKLVDSLPPLSEIKRVANAEDPKAEYEQIVDELFEDPRFERRMIRWWRDTLRQGGGDLDSAPVFAARVMVEGRPFADLFTATENTCPSYDNDAGAFVDGDCDNSVAQHAGLLTNPGTMKQFYGSMAFRRVRWVQEMFACQKFPAEYSDSPQDMGAGQFTSPWDFESVATEPIDFQDTSAVICANCHTSMNHIAPLFGNFDEEGMWQDDIQVMTPTSEPATTELSHWLRAGETTHWRMDMPVADLAGLGQALASDPDVAQCLVARLWNFTMSKEDIVSDLATVPTEVIAPYVDEFANSGDMKAMLRAMMKGEDFVRF